MKTISTKRKISFALGILFLCGALVMVALKKWRPESADPSFNAQRVESAQERESVQQEKAGQQKKKSTPAKHVSWLQS